MFRITHIFIALSKLTTSASPGRLASNHLYTHTYYMLSYNIHIEFLLCMQATTFPGEYCSVTDQSHSNRGGATRLVRIVILLCRAPPPISAETQAAGRIVCACAFKCFWIYVCYFEVNIYSQPGFEVTFINNNASGLGWSSIRKAMSPLFIPFVVYCQTCSYE